MLPPRDEPPPNPPKLPPDELLPLPKLLLRDGMLDELRVDVVLREVLLSRTTRVLVELLLRDTRVLVVLRLVVDSPLLERNVVVPFSSTTLNERRELPSRMRCVPPVEVRVDDPLPPPLVDDA